LAQNEDAVMSAEVSHPTLLALVAKGIARWRMSPGAERGELVQEAYARWLRLPVAGTELPLEERVRSMVGIARNVRREWRRAAARQRRLLADLARRQGAPVVGAALDHAAELRAAAIRRLAMHMAREDAEVLFLVRWDDLAWKDAFAAVGVEGESEIVARRKKILRILSTEGVQKSLVGWLERSGLPFPS